jgi:hypothetical protein
LKRRNSCCRPFLIMPRIDPGLVPVITHLERGLREVRVPFAIVGALVPELLLEARPAQMTNDADVTVFIQSFADFETLQDRLAAFGFTRTRVPHRMQHTSGGLVDLLPFSAQSHLMGVSSSKKVIFNMARFSQVVPHALPTKIEGGPMPTAVGHESSLLVAKASTGGTTSDAQSARSDKDRVVAAGVIVVAFVHGAWDLRPGPRARRPTREGV